MRLCICALLLSGCHAATEEHTIHLIGGHPLPDSHPLARNAVALVTNVDGADEVTCSGALIAPEVVLTAAHCVSPQVVSVVPHAVFLGGSFAQQQGELVNISSISIHPDFALGTLSSFRGALGKTYRFQPNDLAVVRLESPAPPSSWQPIPLLPRDSRLLRSARLTQAPNGIPTWLPATELMLAGFGSQDRSELVGLGYRRFLTARFSESNPTDPSVFAVTQPSQAQDTCLGDSGGPAYVRDGDTWFLAGILSYGTMPCEGTWSTYMRAAEFLPWLERQ